MTRAFAIICSLWLCACLDLDEGSLDELKQMQMAPARSPAAASGEPEAAGDAGTSAETAGAAGSSADVGPVDDDTAGRAGTAAEGDGAGSDAAGAGGRDPEAGSAADDPRCGDVAIDGDGCCPAGADLASDRDCCAAPLQLAAQGQNERSDSARELGDVAWQAVAASGSGMNADYAGLILGCGATDAVPDAAYTFVPSAANPLELALNGGEPPGTLALFAGAPARTVFGASASMPGCRGLSLPGHTYFACDESVQWMRARERCEQAGLALVRIDDAGENAALTAAAGGVARWIALNDRDDEGSYVWLDGSAPSYSAWAPGNPNGPGNQDCTELLSDGSWNDRNCGDALPFVCEAPGRYRGDRLAETDVIMLDDAQYVLSGDAAAYGVDRDPGLDVCGADAAFPDSFVALELTRAARVEVDSSGSAFAPVLALYARSAGALAGSAPLGCHDSATAGAVASFELAAGSYALVVTGHGAPGAFHLVVHDGLTPGGELVGCATGTTPLAFTPTAGTRYYAIVKSTEAHVLTVTPQRCL